MNEFLHATYLNPLTDFGFKKLFSTENNKELLIDFLNALIDKPDKIVDIRYLETAQLGRTAKDRNAIFDIHCITDQEEWFVIEMQVVRQAHFLDRCLYYSTFPIQNQAKKGKWNYELKPLYHIAILNFEQYDDTHCISHLSIIREETMKKATDKLNLILIELPKFKKTLAQSDKRIDQWLYCFKYLEKLKERPEELSGKVFETLFEEAEINKLTLEEMKLYIKRYPPENEWNNALDYAVGEARKEAMERGIEKGMEEGRKEGFTLRNYEIAKKLLDLHIPVKDIVNATGLTPEQILAL
jgi:predicted transposase/invertase (TIGR01784 family)